MKVRKDMENKKIAGRGKAVRKRSTEDGHKWKSSKIFILNV
jgi:hypothetical protein